MLKFTRNVLCKQIKSRPSINLHSRNLVRVRFAPSPTGYLHLGGLRTALYNYLFAKSQNGAFILRIEDTDQSRLVNDAEKNLINDLEWAGVRIDEGPGHGGGFGPYVQSERLELYRSQVKQLLENGSAYYCFCSERRLDLLRKDAARSRQIPKYDNKCRHLTPVQIAAKLTNNEEFCIRFKLIRHTEPFNDLIFGDVVHDVSETEGDPVIIKTDGFPTYHFANVVDDHAMEITHVFRGLEWQISTTKHILMYKAFGWNPPKYGHLPLLVNQDGTKLSKRQGDIRIGSFRDSGIYPLALLNYVIQAGGGFENQNVDTHLKIYPLDQLTNNFKIEKINCNPGRLNPDLLKEFNRLEIIRQISDPETCDKLIKEVQQLVRKTFPKLDQNLDLNYEHVRNILQWSVNRLDTLNDLVDQKLAFLWILPKNKTKSSIEEKNLDELINVLNSANFVKSNIQGVLKDFTIKNNLDFSTFMQSMREELSGLKEGPGVAEIMEILGKKGTLERLKRTKN